MVICLIFFPIESETAQWLCRGERCFNIRRKRVVYTSATEIQFGMTKIKHYAIQKTGVRGCHSPTRLAFPPLPPSQKETLPASLQATGLLQSWCKRSAGPPVLWGCASVDVPVAGRSKRSRVISLMECRDSGLLRAWDITKWQLWRSSVECGVTRWLSFPSSS